MLGQGDDIPSRRGTNHDRGIEENKENEKIKAIRHISSTRSTKASFPRTRDVSLH